MCKGELGWLSRQVRQRQNALRTEREEGGDGENTATRVRKREEDILVFGLSLSSSLSVQKSEAEITKIPLDFCPRLKIPYHAMASTKQTVFGMIQVVYLSEVGSTYSY